jgi:HPt (histidine-containing phosphotransfer) domain-containing protein
LEGYPKPLSNRVDNHLIPEDGSTWRSPTNMEPKDSLDKSRIQVHIDADLEDMIPEYLANRHRDVELIYKALAASDYETIRIAGHSMKGGGGYGFDVIIVYGHILENAANNNNSEEICKTIESLKRFLEVVEVIYEK